MILPKHLRLFTNILLIAFSLSCTESNKGSLSKSQLAALEQKASEGDLESQLKLLRAYIGDDGVEKNSNEAFYWATKAADQDNAEAQYHLGVCYTKGSGTKKDLTAAFNWFKASAEQSYPLGEYRLGICYLDGEGIPINEASATEWLEKAANQNVPRAQLILGDYFHQKSLRVARVEKKIFISTPRFLLRCS